ncbi:NTP/NDP exchange transporter [Advenella mimigardefordensis]|uniref:NTP/NDP exchange transporter n=1 Tax=Advenella mimigardefordensis TaxID=302406 RepID=UPI0004AFAD4A|nr:MFS transporter [Advenella mimigardefordensis]
MRKIVQIHPGEGKALAWSWLYVFSLFLAYYILRPIREELGVAGGVNNLPWLFTGTLIAMTVINPLFAWVVKRWPRERFIAIAYRFFMLNLVAFMLLLMNATPEQHVWIGRAFFIWVSVFNLFVISVFWSFMVDVFSGEQAKRVFGFLATGATVGGIAGSALTSGLVERLGQTWLLLISIVLLEVAVFATRRLSGISDAFKRPIERREGHEPVGGGLLAGITHTFRSPYLLGIAIFILCYAVTSTILYFQQATIAEQYFADRAARTAFFADISLWVNCITLGVQLFLTGRIMQWLGVALTLCAMPMMSMLGFAGLATFPGIGLFVVFQVVRNVSNYALTRPAREVLFTAVSREDRYKTKNFIDTVVYRGGDQIAAWSYAGLLAIGLSLTGIAAIAVPLSAIWLILGVWLGRRQQRWESTGLVTVEGK